MKIRVLALILAVLTLLTSCASGSKVFKTDFGPRRKDYNDSFAVKDVPLTNAEVADDFSLTVEAESGVMTGVVETKHLGASGDKTVSGFDADGDSLIMKVTVPSDGVYDIGVRYFSPDISKINLLYVDGVHQADLRCNVANKLDSYPVKGVYLSKGDHEIEIRPSWGWVEFDSITLTKSSAVNDDTYNVTVGLSNPNADENTRRLYNFLCDIYGNYTLTGQTADHGRLSPEYERIKEITGKEFAVLGLDMMNYSLTNKKYGAVGESMPYASDWYHNMGGIVSFCWHWNSPKSHIADGANWWNSFYSENSDIDLDKAMNGEDDKLLEKLDDDIRNISEELTKLRDDGVPILWRPLHEASGGWFWWGDCEPESYIKLWRRMYDIMTNEYNLTNLIWIWNAQHGEWYPGDDVVDIISTDIYTDAHSYSSHSPIFIELTEATSQKKLIALSENGVVMDPELCFRDNARWLFWCTWTGDYGTTDIYTEDYMLEKAYNSEYTLTLDELPNLKEYRLD